MEELLIGGKREALPEEDHENYIATTVRVEKLVSSYCLCSGNIGFIACFSGITVRVTAVRVRNYCLLCLAK